jgi:tRNA A-37 threonylcarbamoyl transferase component Bud32
MAAPKEIIVLLLFLLACPLSSGQSTAEDWPGGEYSIPRLSSGECPGLGGFHTGDVVLTFDSKFDVVVSKSRENDLPVSVTNLRTLDANFCIRNTSVNGGHPDWPSGSYCLFMSGNRCPDIKFSMNSITVEKFVSQNTFCEVLEDLNNGINCIGQNSMVYDVKWSFCCRNDATTDIIRNQFSSNANFVLLPYGRQQCQPIMGTEVTQQYVHLHNKMNASNGQITVMGNPPVAVNGQKDMAIIFFCHYSLLNNTRPTGESDSLNGGQVAGIVFGAIFAALLLAVVIALVAFGLWCIIKKKSRKFDRILSKSVDEPDNSNSYINISNLPTEGHVPNHYSSSRRASNRPPTSTSSAPTLPPRNSNRSSSKVQSQYKTLTWGGRCPVHTDLPQVRVESDVKFSDPPSDKDHLVSELEKKNLVIDDMNIRIQQDMFAHGNFSSVYRAHIVHDETCVAVKRMIWNGVLKSDVDQAIVSYLEEAVIMSQFDNKHIVKIIGVVNPGSMEQYIVMEYLPNGTLKTFLKKELSPTVKNKTIEDCEAAQTLVRFAREIADGMNYLSGKGFVHRDLAARNILLDANHVCKIGDFGMAKKLANTYYIIDDITLAGMWAPLEYYDMESKYSTASDVWSYACVLYEMWSLGKDPFLTEAGRLRRALREGKRLPPPPGCPRAFYHLMIDCW